MNQELRHCFGSWSSVDDECMICDIQNDCRYEAREQAAVKQRYQQYRQPTSSRGQVWRQEGKPVQVQQDRYAPNQRMTDVAPYRVAQPREGVNPWWDALWSSIFAAGAAAAREVSEFLRRAPCPDPPMPRLPAAKVEQLPPKGPDDVGRNEV